MIRLDGRFADGAMRLEGEKLAPAGRSRDRITWTPRPDGTVRQLWETFSDADGTWRVVFDGTYRKK